MRSDNMKYAVSPLIYREIEEGLSDHNAVQEYIEERSDEDWAISNEETPFKNNV